VPPLAGTTVADLTRYLPGPFASRELQRLGARVVKIEPPDGDPSRTASPDWYRALNEGKRVIAWDAHAEPPPPELLEADVVLEGFRPGVWERLGVTLPPSTILCSITGFGAKGAHAAQAAHAHDAAMQQYVRSAATSNGKDTAAGITELAELRDRGVITEAEFQQGKAKALAG